jgi:hypothetical protein
LRAGIKHHGNPGRDPQAGPARLDCRPAGSRDPQGALQLSLLDKWELAETTSPDYPGERLMPCRNPLLADERARKRRELLDIQARVRRDKDKIALAPRQAAASTQTLSRANPRVGSTARALPEGQLPTKLGSMPGYGFFGNPASTSS